MDILQTFFSRLERVGISTQEVLKATPLAGLRTSCSAVPEDTLKVLQIFDWLARIAPPDIGIQLASQWSFDDYGPYTSTLRHCRNLCEATFAYKLLQRHAERPLYFFKDHCSRGEWRIEFISSVLHGPGSNIIIEELVARTRLELTEYLGRTPSFIKVELAYPQPPHKNQYEDMFQCRVLYNQRHNVVTVDSECLDQPLATTTADSPAPLLDSASLDCESSQTIASAILSLLLFNPGVHPPLTWVATELGMSQSTIKRLLAREGTNYRALLDRVLSAHTYEYLAFTNKPPKEIAHRLGFTNVNNFRRAFRRWTGTTPGRFRKAVSPLILSGEVLH